MLSRRASLLKSLISLSCLELSSGFVVLTIKNKSTFYVKNEIFACQRYRNRQVAKFTDGVIAVSAINVALEIDIHGLPM